MQISPQFFDSNSTEENRTGKKKNQPMGMAHYYECPANERHLATGECIWDFAGIEGTGGHCGCRRQISKGHCHCGSQMNEMTAKWRSHSRVFYVARPQKLWRRINLSGLHFPPPRLPHCICLCFSLFFFLFSKQGVVAMRPNKTHLIIQ